MAEIAKRGLAKRKDQERARQTEHAERSLSEFVRQAWHVVEPGKEYLHNWHIDAIAEHLEAVTRGEIRRLLVNVPFRFMKSTLVSVLWPAWTWIDEPEHQWLCGSYAAKLAIRDNLKMRRLIESPWFRERWGDRFELTSDQNQKIRFENDRTGYRIAFGFESGVMGDGGDTVLIDDPHDRNQAHSDAERETSLVTFDEAITTRLNQPASSSIVIIMQRLHEQDLSGHLLAKGGYEHLLIPMHYDPARARVTVIGWSDPRTQAGELAWPERFPTDVVEQIEKDIGSYAAAGQLEQRPAPAEGGIFKLHWWRFYDELPKRFNPQTKEWEPEKFDTELQSWDLAFKGTATSNFVAGQAWARKGARCYMKPDEVYAQLDFPKTCAAFVSFSERHPYSTKLVEDKANGPALISTLSGTIPGIVPVSSDGGAEAVAHAVSPYVEAGNVWLPNPYNGKADESGIVTDQSSVRSDRQWVVRFMANCATFPNGSVPAGSHGDDVVAATQAIHRLMHGVNSGHNQIEALRRMAEKTHNDGS